jgi:hypothetical protein
MVVQDLGNIVIRIPGVNHGGLAYLSGNGELGLERMALGGPGGMIVVIVQAGFPDRYHSGITQEVSQPALGGRIPALRIMRVDTGGGHEPRLAWRQFEGSFRARPGFTDHYDVRHPGSPRALQHGSAIGVVGRISEVTVGVD